MFFLGLVVFFFAIIEALFNELPLHDRLRHPPPAENVIFPDNARLPRDAGTEGCDITVNEDEGWLFSPNYPSNYGNQQSCNFLVERSRRDVCEVEITLMDFDLDDATGCFGDYLDISEGSPPVPGGGKLCGSLASGTKKRLSFPRGRQSLLLRFHSDGAKTRKGFMIKVIQIPNSCNRQPDPFDDDSGARCDQFVSGYESVIRSPGYPNRYPSQTRCRYTLQRPDAGVCKVELNFLRFDLEYSPGCRSDYLELPGGNRLCGSIVTPAVLEYPASGASLILAFSSDQRGTGSGYDIAVRQVPGSCGRSPQPQPVPPRPRDDCDQLVTGLRTRLAYRADYNRDNYRRCRFVIRQLEPSVCSVSVILERFHLDSGDRNCFREYLQLPDGTRLCGTLTGRKTLRFPRYDRYLTLEYVNEGVRTSSGRGFDLAIVQLQNSCQDWSDNTYCDQDVTGYDSRVMSPGFPGEYGPNHRCTYAIRRADHTVCLLAVDFYFFDLERSRSGNCDQDFLEMPDGSRLCGIVSGERVYKFPAGSGNMALIFNSDHFGTGKGFELRIRQRPNSCGTPTPAYCDQKLDSETAVIRSPGYPSEYTGGLRCIYTVQRISLDTCQVRMDFLEFDLDGGRGLCSEDYLEVEHTGERLCGSNIRNTKVLTFPTNADAMQLILKTDSVRHRKGFEIRLTQVRSSCYRGAVDPDQRLPVCATIREYSGTIQSENHPLPYAANQECTYRLVRASAEVCRLEFYLGRFDVGSGSDSLCLGDYLEIADTRYCGRRDGQTVRVNFPEGQNEFNFRFRSDGYEQHSGFRVDIRQVISGCDDREGTHKCGATYAEETFDLISPGFRNGSYPSSEDCRYLVRKAHNDICAIEVRYNVFDLQDSQDCAKDFLEISEQKICGKLPFDSTRTYEFPEDTMTIRFRSDPGGSGAGFFLTVKQVQC